MTSEVVRSSIWPVLSFFTVVACCTTSLNFFLINYFIGTVYWQAEGKGGLLLMSAYCINTVSSPLFLSAILMAHLNKALNVSSWRSLKSYFCVMLDLVKE